MALSNVVPQGGSSNYVSQFLQVTNELIVLVNQLLGGNISINSFNVTGNLAVTQSLYANFIKLNGNDLTNELSNIFLTNNTQSVYVNVAGALANAAGVVANAAFLQANAGFPIANAVYNFANTIQPNPAAIFATANAAYGTINSSGASANTAVAYQISFENRIVNGDFRIDQRQEGGLYVMNVNNSVQWGPDTWNLRYFPPGGNNFANGTTGDLMWAVRNQGPVPKWQNNSITITNTHNTAPYLLLVSLQNTNFSNANTAATLEHWIEGPDMSDFRWGYYESEKNNIISYSPNPNAAPVMLTFWAWASNTGNYSLILGNNSQSRYYLTSYNMNVANSWIYQTIPIPGDQMGTWTTDVGCQGMLIKWGLGGSADLLQATGGITGNVLNQWTNSVQGGVVNAGVPFRAPNTVNILADAGNVFALKQVRLRAGSFDVPYRPREYQHELNLCKRRFQKSWPQGAAVGANNAYYQPMALVLYGPAAGSNGPPVGGYGYSIAFAYDTEIAAPVGLLGPNAGTGVTLYGWSYYGFPTPPYEWVEGTIWNSDTDTFWTAEAGEGYTKYFNTLWNTGNITWPANSTVFFHYTIASPTYPGIG